MIKKISAIIMGIVLVSAVAIPAVVFAADNEAEQSASTLQATTIAIKDQAGTTAVTTITFPAGDPGATVSNPSNSESQEQVFGAAEVAKPVVTLDSPASYTVWYQVENFSNSVVASEYFALLAHDAACADADAVSTAMTLDDTPYTTEISITDAAVMDLYLKVTLGSVAGETGTSTLTILGES
ncbi:MAG: hypothetical protein JW790_03345 [Dehalococcoidales bacterium]|nr:hypothetical protein [Dehalococcoidales bacterium]